MQKAFGGRTERREGGPMRRIDGYGRVDRAVDVKFSFDGVQYLGHPGDTLASALLANDVTQISTSVALGRPRGVMAAGVDEASALVQIDAKIAEIRGRPSSSISSSFE